jgi:membrane fusion protein, multidrug efflux system
LRRLLTDKTISDTGRFMAKFKFHRLASFIVLIVAAAWVLTGEFSAVGSQAQEKAEAATNAPAAEAKKALRTVAVLTPPLTDHAVSIRISGVTESDKRVALATRAGGIITELAAKQGDAVKSGDVILSLDAEDKKSMVKTAEQALTQRKTEMASSEALAKRGNLAKRALDEARTALVTAQSQLESAQAELTRLQVIAPFDGVLDKVDVQNGSSVQQGAPVATLLSLDPIIAVGEISERSLGSVKIGGKAQVRLVDGRMADGTIRYISKEANAQTRTYRVEVAITNADLSIPAGMTAEVMLWAAPVKAIQVPRSVVTLSQDGDFGVRGIDKDNKAFFLPVTLIDDATNALVLTGVPDGTRVIVSGQDLVKDGETVTPVAPDAELMKKLVSQASTTQ